jgi:hypothetical protein
MGDDRAAGAKRPAKIGVDNAHKIAFARVLRERK